MRPDDPSGRSPSRSQRRDGPIRTLVGGALVGIAALVAALLALADPAGAQMEPDLTDATATVDPATGLVDRQQVRITGSDFDPAGGTFGVAQCAASVIGTMEVGSCDLDTSVLGTVASDGSIDVTLTVRRIITTAGGEIDCAVEGACLIGVGTLESDLLTPIEGTAAPIGFDPSVPPVPELELDVSVDGVDGNLAHGTVTCNRPAGFDVTVSVEQTRGTSTTYASGFHHTDIPGCDVEPVEFAVPLVSGGGRLVGGPATFDVSAFAFDGVESAFFDGSGDLMVGGAQRLPLLQPAAEGEWTSVAVVDVEGRAADQRVVVEVVCERPFTQALVWVQVAQFAGRHTVSALATTMLEGCDGTHVLELPIDEAQDGVLAGGPARVSASISAQGFEPPDLYFDNASSHATVTLRGLVRAPGIDVEPNPDSRITIDGVSKDAIVGTITCERPAEVFMSGSTIQTRGRSSTTASGFTELECDDVTPFAVPVDGELRGGVVDAFVSADAYTDEDPFGEFLFADHQEASTRVHGEGGGTRDEGTDKLSMR